MLRRWPGGSQWLFPRPKVNPLGMHPFGLSTLNRGLQRWANALDLRMALPPDAPPGAVAPLVHLTAHRFRHTIATRMINEDVPQYVVQRFLGHESAKMTERYTIIHDKTLGEAFKRYRQRVTASGEVVVYQPDSPMSDGMRLTDRLKRAREATERAQRAEHLALAEASEAKQLADEARATSEEGRRRIRQVKSETADRVKQRVAGARRRADEMVEEERAKAQAEADDTVRKVSVDVDGRVEKTRERADAAQEKAQASIADATEQMADARRLADDAAEAAQNAAAEAQRQAEELAAEARRHAGATTSQVAEAETVQRQAAGAAAEVTTQLRSPDVDGDVKSMTKGELMDLAVALGVEGRTSMNKQQLVAAVNRESKKSR